MYFFEETFNVAAFSVRTQVGILRNVTCFLQETSGTCFSVGMSSLLKIRFQTAEDGDVPFSRLRDNKGGREST